MKKLLVFTENYVRGGSNRYLTDVVNGLAKRFDRAVIASNPNGVYAADIARLQMQASTEELPIHTRARMNYFLRRLPFVVRAIPIVLVKPIEPLLFLYNTLLLIALIRRTKPALILSFSGGYPAGQGALAMVLASRIERVPVALSIVSMPRRRYCPLYEHLLDGMVWRSADLVIVNARSIADDLHSRRGMPLHLARVVHNGLEVLQEEKKGPRRNQDRFTIGCITRMDRAKGVTYLFEAFSRLAPRFPDLHLMLVGEGPALKALKKKSVQRGLQGRVTFTGYIEGPIEEFLERIDLYVFPSLHEGLPYSILEAMRAGCPIIATSVGGIPEAITDARDGLLVQPGSVSALQEAIERCLRSPENLRKLGENARLRFQRDFSVTTMHELLGAIFPYNGETKT